MKPSVVPDPDTATVCPIAIVLSGSADATLGQVNDRPPALTVEPGVMLSAASPSEEYDVPMPSNPMNPDDGFTSESSVIPVLLNVAASEDAGTFTVAVATSELVPLYVAEASRLSVPVDSPEDGAVTVNVADRDEPGVTVPTEVGPDGETVHPVGAFSARDASRIGAPAGLRSVSTTVNEDVASVVDGTAARVGVGGVGAPYTAGL